MNKYSSKAQSQVARASIDAHIRDPTRGTKIVTAIAATPQPRAAYAGALPDSTINVPSLHQPLSEFSMDFQDEIQFQTIPMWRQFIMTMVMGNPGLECGLDLEVAVHNVAEPVTQPKTRLNAGGT